MARGQFANGAVLPLNNQLHYKKQTSNGARSIDLRHSQSINVQSPDRFAAFVNTIYSLLRRAVISNIKKKPDLNSNRISKCQVDFQLIML
ncbi:hypothetical protein AVEN_104293-1 [Araneus ventricosus]|uniref:Uncharacterized protein n=1 Tax=Araneus ventricosus TaxID=182803 RepID=A0A4Y2T7M4_ARAVE|nr:hypothetical protein AVEN_104293-1 [Araneus ventricosus]